VGGYDKTCKSDGGDKKCILNFARNFLKSRKSEDREGGGKVTLGWILGRYVVHI
jgi:hypothetical protein